MSLVIVLSHGKTESDKLTERILQFAAEHLDPVYRPVKYYFIDKFPLTKVGKVDYMELEKEAGESAEK